MHLRQSFAPVGMTARYPAHEWLEDPTSPPTITASDGRIPWRMVEATWEPGGSSGWHTHPGPAVISVIEGAVTVTNANDCVPRTYGEGEAFLDPGQGNIHIATNASDEDEAKAAATFVGVPDGEPATIPTDPADC